MDEFTRECLALDVNKTVKGQDVVEVLRYLFAVRGQPDYIRSDNGPEFANRAVRRWLRAAGVKTLFVAPGSPWENEYYSNCTSLVA
jgi:transposase InsO family protein